MGQRPEAERMHGAMVARGFQGEQARGGGCAPAPVDPRRWPAAHELARVAGGSRSRGGVHPVPRRTGRVGVAERKEADMTVAAGGSWLIDPVGSAPQFTGADFTDDDLLYAKTAEDFVRNE